MVIVRVENPYNNIAYSQLFGKLEAEADLFKVKFFKPARTSLTWRQLLNVPAADLFLIVTYPYCICVAVSATAVPGILFEVGPQTECNVVIFHHRLHVARFGVNVVVGPL